MNISQATKEEERRSPFSERRRRKHGAMPAKADLLDASTPRATRYYLSLLNIIGSSNLQVSIYLESCSPRPGQRLVACVSQPWSDSTSRSPDCPLNPSHTTLPSIAALSEPDDVYRSANHPGAAPRWLPSWRGTRPIYSWSLFQHRNHFNLWISIGTPRR